MKNKINFQKYFEENDKKWEGVTLEDLLEDRYIFKGETKVIPKDTRTLPEFIFETLIPLAVYHELNKFRE